jgi:hypothetical protein
MMFIMFYIFGLVFTQGASAYVWQEDRNDMDPAKIDSLLFDFGSVEKSMFTLFKAATGGDDWAMYFSVIKETGVMYSTVYLFFIVFNNIAFMNILTALFVENASKLAQPDRDAIVMAQRENLKKEVAELKRITSQVDKDSSGNITEEEFDNHMNSKGSALRSYLEFKGVDRKDAKTFFQMLSYQSHDGKVHVESFIIGAMKIKGAASSLDIQAVSCLVRMKLDRNSKEIQELAQDLATLRAEQRELVAEVREAEDVTCADEKPKATATDRWQRRSGEPSPVAPIPLSLCSGDNDEDDPQHVIRDEGL